MTPTVLHLFAGSGGGALGFQRAGFHSLGALDYDPEACADLTYLTGEPATCIDLRAVEPADLRRIAGDRRPDVVFTSSPCVGFSGCLPERRSREATYLDFNELAVRGVWLALETWADRPPLIVFENVPRIRTRGAYLLDQIIGLLHHYGYATDQRIHDCGEVGGLAQHRQRFLLVARHQATVPGFLNKPPRQRVRAVGEVLASLPVPELGDADRSMHRLPKLSALNWLRLAAIPPGKDWRSLPAEIRLPARDQRLNGGFGVNVFDEPAHTIVGEGSVRNTWSSVADPRLGCEPRSGAYGVLDPGAPASTVIGHHVHDRAPASIADPRLDHAPRRGTMGVLDGAEPAPTVRGHHDVRQAPAAFADPRLAWDAEAHNGRPDSFGVLDWSRPSPTIRGKSLVQTSRSAVADPRWPTPTHQLRCEAGALVLDGPHLDLDDRRPIHLVIEAIDGTWHRPLTDLELAVIQGFPAFRGGEMLVLRGPSSHRRKHIGNAVPPPTAEAIARECMATLEAAADGTWRLGGGGVWVREEATWPR